MEFCQNCGHKLSQGQQFCPECGTVQKRDVTAPVDPPKPEQKRGKEKNSTPVFFQSKVFKILAPVIIVIIIALFGTYKYISSTLTPEKVEEQFVDAVKTHNVKEMKKIINQNETELTISDRAISDFFAYFKKHPDVLSEVVNQLKTDAGNLAANKDYDNRKNPVNLVKDGKKWLVFDYYAVNLKPYYLKIQTSKKPVKMEVNGKSVGEIKEDKATFGPYFLSDLKVKGTYQAPYTAVTEEKSLDPYEEKSQNLNVDMNFSGNTVTVYSNNDQAILYVNGKSTGKKIADINEYGPVPVDGSMKMQAVLQVGSHTVKSNEESVMEDGQEIDLELPVTDFDGSDTGYSTDTSYQDSGDGTANIGQVVTDHYQDISNADYETAYNLMSTSRRNKYNFADWEKGLKNNYKNDVQISDVQKIDDTHATVSFSLTSYDQQSNGSTLVQVWGGKWNLLNENGQWLLNSPDIKKLDSYTQ